MLATASVLLAGSAAFTAPASFATTTGRTSSVSMQNSGRLSWQPKWKQTLAGWPYTMPAVKSAPASGGSADLSLGEVTAFMCSSLTADASLDEKVAFLEAKGVSAPILASVMANIQCEAFSSGGGADTVMSLGEVTAFMCSPSTSGASVDEKVAFLEGKGVAKSVIESVLANIDVAAF